MVMSSVEVAFTITFVAEDTIGAVSTPEDDTCPAFVVHVTAELKFPVPVTVAEHWLVWPDVTDDGEHDTVTDVIVDGTGFTVMVVVPSLVVSCVEVAVIVTGMVDDTVGAVNKPEEDICPALALQVTAELKFPVPVTVAEHWLVWPDVTVEGEHEAVTDVMVDVLPPPPLPPQAAINTKLPIANRIASLRTALSPSADVTGLDALRH
jgi:hypothetical protein